MMPPTGPDSIIAAGRADDEVVDTVAIAVRRHGVGAQYVQLVRVTQAIAVGVAQAGQLAALRRDQVAVAVSVVAWVGGEAGTYAVYTARAEVGSVDFGTPVRVNDQDGDAAPGLDAFDADEAGEGLGQVADARPERDPESDRADAHGRHQGGAEVRGRGRGVPRRRAR